METEGQILPLVTTSSLGTVHLCDSSIYIYTFKLSLEKIALRSVSCIYHFYFKFSIIIFRHKIYLVIIGGKLRQCLPSHGRTSFPK